MYILDTDHKIDKKLIVINWSKRIVTITLILFVFLLSIDLMSQSLVFLGKGMARDLLSAAEMPFIALFIGLLSTAVLQSSSTVTSMAVAMVASQAISLSSGIFIVMGANIGTTLTSDIVSLSFITNRSEFRKAISAATIHDFFNLFTTFILFPLEYYYGFLSRVAGSVAGLFNYSKVSGSINFSGSGNFIMKPVTDFIMGIGINPWIILVFSILLIFLTIKLFANYSFKLLIGDSKDKLKQYIFSNKRKSFLWGFLLTGMIQSSSISTSLVVPLVATRKVTLRAVFPFILGANIGTAITAILAALFKSETALSLALAHLIFNAIGVLIVMPFPAIMNVFVIAAEKFGYVASSNRLVGFFYILFAFFLIPFLLIYLSQVLL